MIDRIPPVLLVAIGGSLGAITRYMVSNLYSDNSAIPYGTLTVNVIGSFLLGILITLYEFDIIDQPLFILTGIGFMGSFTTMSSFAIDTLLLLDRSTGLALKNISIMLLLVFIGALTGKYLSRIGLTKCGVFTFCN